jgi:hypothetical protein
MKKVFILFLLIGAVHISYGQRWKLLRYEVIGGIGAASYFGDIGGSASSSNLYGLGDISILNTRPAIMIGARYKIQDNLCVKTSFIFAFLHGNDAGSKLDTRKLYFNSTLFEPSAQVEYYFIPEERRYMSAASINRKGMINNYSRISAYGFLGLGGAFFSPKLQGDVSQQKSSEISGYSKMTMVIPFGLGVKYAIDSRSSINFELGRRYVFSDFIDGFNSEYSKSKDVYYFGIFSYSYKLKTNRKGLPVLHEWLQFFK